MAKQVVSVTTIAGKRVNKIGFPEFFNQRETTNRVAPATSWLVVPKSGHRIRPPFPLPWVIARTKAAPIPTAAATNRFLRAGSL